MHTCEDTETARVVFASRRPGRDARRRHVYLTAGIEGLIVEKQEFPGGWPVGGGGGGAKGEQIRESRKKGRDCNLLNLTVKRDS